jgi:cyclohexadienyl dehydratase
MASRTVVAVALSCVLSAAALGAEPVLRVGTSGDYAPFSLRGRGFDVAVAQALAHDLGLRIEWVRFAWPELRADVAAGRFDVAMGGITWRPERAVIGWMSRAVAQGGPCVVGDPASGPIAVNRGGVLESWARRRFAPNRLIAIDDNLSLPMLLAGGAVGAFVTDSFELSSRPRPARAAVRCEPARDRKVYWIAPSRAAELGSKVDRWLADNERRLAELRARWLGRAASRGEIDDLVDQLARRLAFMPAVGAWKRARGAPIEDPEREQAVLAAAEHDARSKGLDATSVRRFFAVQLDLAKSIQRRADPNAPALDLEKEIRPALSRIGEQIVDRLAAVAPLDGAALDEDRLAPLGELLNEQERARLRSALLEVRRTGL